MTLPIHVALVDETNIATQTTDWDWLTPIAGSLNLALLGEFHKEWEVRASIGVWRKAPADTWAIKIRDSLDEPDALGYHTTEHNQPISYVEYTGPDTPITISHELFEMLADPSGNRMHGGRLPWGVEKHFRDYGLKTKDSHVKYLLEVCDPPEAAYYEIGETPVSDFITHRWYDSFFNPGVRYSYAGVCTQPRQVVNGGYVSFHVNGNWFQIFNEGGKLVPQSLGRFDKKAWGSIREFTDHFSRARRSN